MCRPKAFVTKERNELDEEGDVLVSLYLEDGVLTVFGSAIFWRGDSREKKFPLSITCRGVLIDWLIQISKCGAFQ